MDTAPQGYTVIAGRLVSNPHLLGVVLTLILVAGVSTFHGLPRIEDPRITNRNALIVTTLPGATAPRVEALVTEPIEVALRELSEIKTIESTSRPGVSLVSIELIDAVDDSTNEAAFARVRDQIAAVRARLPVQASAPELDDERGAVAFSLVLALSLDGEETMAITTRLGEELADRLRSVGGTELVRLYGGAHEEITVEVDRDRTAALGLTLGDLARTVTSADVRSPSGAVRSRGRDLLIEVEGEFDSVARIERVPVADNGQGGLVALGDIARVRKGVRSPPDQIAMGGGRRVVLVAARVEDGVQLSAWSERAGAVVAEFERELGAGIGLDVLFDQSRYTEQRLGLLSENLLGGAVLVMLVVLFAMGWRAALVVWAALPLSAAAIVFGLGLTGQPIHQMSIFGMIIAVGLLIDNAIVVTDEVRSLLAAGRARAEAIAIAVRHLRVPLLASTLTTVLGFMPVFLLPGNVGDFVRPIAMSVILALLASFAISMTIIVALAGSFLPGRSDKGRRWWEGGWTNDRAAGAYRRVLCALMRRPAVSVAIALTLPVAGFAAASNLDLQFFPSADRDQFEIELRLDANASIARTAEKALEVEAFLRTRSEIRRVDWLVGASYPSVYYNLVMNQDDDPGYAHGIVTTSSPESADALLASLQSALDETFPEVHVVVGAFGQGPPVEAPVELRVIGPDPERLARYGEELRRIAHDTPGITHTRATIRRGEAKLRFEVDEERARLAGLSLGEVSRQLQHALEGVDAGLLLEDLESLPVRIRYHDFERGSVERIATTGFVSASSSVAGLWTPAIALGEWKLAPELSSITRRDGERVNEVLATVAHGALPIEVTRQLEARLRARASSLAPGYRLEAGGNSEEQGEAVRLLATYAPVLGLSMLGILVLSFGSVRLAALVGVVAVLSVGLGLLSLWLAGFPVGFNPLIGSAGLIGVAINGSIVVLAALRADDGARTGDVDAVVDVTLRATRHIVATTLTTAGAFAPLVFLMGGSFWPPLAVVIAGGVGFSIVLSLVFSPAAYRLLHWRRPESDASQRTSPCASPA